MYLGYNNANIFSLDQPIKEIVTINNHSIICAYQMHKFISLLKKNAPLLLFFAMLHSQGCSSTASKTPSQPDPQKVKQASIMTNKCLLNHHDVPGSLTQRQECLNQASALLLDAYGPEIQRVARLCAQKLAQIAAEADAGQIDLRGYQQKREMLQIECAREAQAAQK